MYRERLTITLDASLLQAVDSLIDGERLRNRSQTIEHLLREGVGLHGLTQAFIFITPQTDASALPGIAVLCAAAGISTFYLSLTMEDRHREAELSEVIRQQYAAARKACVVETVPADFGSGGSVLLQKEKLTSPFLLAWPTAAALPSSLLPPFIFHRAHHGLLTELTLHDGTGGRPCGVYVANPDLAVRIPAGITDLRKDTFPALVKEGTVKGYFYSL